MKSASIFLAIAAHAATWDNEMLSGDRYRNAGQYAEAADTYRAALAQAGDGRQRAITANNLASLCAELKQYGEARRLYHVSLDTWQRTLPSDAPEIATTLNNLGALYASERRYRDAAWYYQRSLAIRTQPSTLNNLAEMYRAQGWYTEAEKIFRQLITTLPPEDPALGTVLNNMGELCRQKGRTAEAGEFYRRALEVWERTLGPGHPYKAATLRNLAQLKSEQKSAMAIAFK
jgi:tetratricopeptide (TPR) repeat protein